MTPIYQQIHLFIVTLVTGLVLGLAFDLYRTVRWIVRPKQIVTFIGDLLFWIVMIWFVFAVLLIASHGEVRLYIFFGLAIGFYLHSLLFSKIVLKLLQTTILFLSRLINRIVRGLQIVVAKLRWVITFIINIISIPLKYFRKIKNKVKSFLKKLVEKIPLPKLPKPKPKPKRRRGKSQGHYSIGKKKGRRKNKKIVWEKLED